NACRVRPLCSYSITSRAASFRLRRRLTSCSCGSVMNPLHHSQILRRRMGLPGRVRSSNMNTPEQRRHYMFTRVVSMTCKPGQAKQACKSICDIALPILKKQKGFLDEIVLVSSTDPNELLGLSFWDSREEAEAYHREQFPKIRERLEDALATAPIVEPYEVDISTAHRVTEGKAA